MPIAIIIPQKKKMTADMDVLFPCSVRSLSDLLTSDVWAEEELEGCCSGLGRAVEEFKQVKI